MAIAPRVLACDSVGPPMRFIALSVALLAGCAAPPPRAVTPHRPAKAILPPPPWQSALSTSEGYEAKPSALHPAVVIRGATLMLGTGRTIKSGTIILERGKIAAVAEGDLPAPAGALTVDAAGKYVTPGLIDTHSHIGVYPMPDAEAHGDGNEATDPVSAFAQTTDAFWPQDPAIERAVAGGVTTIQVLPGSANLIGGRAVSVKLRPGASAREMHVSGAPDGLKMACGENPKRVYGAGRRAPSTRMGNLAMQRAAFLKAKKLIDQWSRFRDQESKRIESDAKKRASYEAKREEQRQRDAYCRENGEPDPCESWRKAWSDSPLEAPEPSDPTQTPDRDLGLETLAAALEGRVLVHVHCYRADDMLAMLALADEVGFRVRSFHHALEAYKIRDQLAARQIGISTWADWWGFKMEAYTVSPRTRRWSTSRAGAPSSTPTRPRGFSASIKRRPRPSRAGGARRWPSAKKTRSAG